MGRVRAVIWSVGRGGIMLCSRRWSRGGTVQAHPGRPWGLRVLSQPRPHLKESTAPSGLPRNNCPVSGNSRLQRLLPLGRPHFRQACDNFPVAVPGGPPRGRSARGAASRQGSRGARRHHIGSERLRGRRSGLILPFTEAADLVPAAAAQDPHRRPVRPHRARAWPGEILRRGRAVRRSIDGHLAITSSRPVTPNRLHREGHHAQ